MLTAFVNVAHLDSYGGLPYTYEWFQDVCAHTCDAGEDAVRETLEAQQ
jgi:hypothetical protein